MPNSPPLKAQRTKLHDKDLPTLEELQEIQSAKLLYSGFVMKRLVEGLLEDSIVPKQVYSGIANFLKHQFFQFINSLEATEFTIRDQIENGLSFINHDKDHRRIRFERPKIVTYGDYLFTAFNAKDDVFVVDLLAVYPFELVGSFKVRNNLITDVITALQTHLASQMINLEWVDDVDTEEASVMVSIVLPKIEKRIQLRINPCLDNQFSEDIVSLQRCNIHPEKLPEPVECDPVPSIYYNQSLIELGIRDSLRDDFLVMFETVPNVSQGMVLLDLLLTNHGLSKKYFLETFKFDTNVLWLYLFKNSLIFNHMSSFQLLRVFLSHFKDGITNLVIINSKVMSKMQKKRFEKQALAEYSLFEERNVGIFIVDGLNVLRYMPLSFVSILKMLFSDMYAMLQYEEGVVVDCFNALFHKKKTVSDHFDYKMTLSDFGLSIQDLTMGLWYENGTLQQLLCQSVDEFAWLFMMEFASVLASLPLFDAVVAVPGEDLQLMLRLNDNYRFDYVLKGPTAKTAAAREFYQFWGELSGLRRFKDGSILETVILPKKVSLVERMYVVVSYLFQRLLLMKVESFKFDLAFTLKVNDAPAKENLDPHFAFDAAYGEVTDIIKGLELPLTVINFSSLSDKSSYIREPTPLFDTPLPADEHSFYEGERVLLTLEHSGGWPEDAVAIDQLKIGFYVEMHAGLRKLPQYGKSLFSAVATNRLIVVFGGYVWSFEIYVPSQRAIYLKEEDDMGTPTRIVFDQFYYAKKHHVSMVKNYLHPNNKGVLRAFRLFRAWAVAKMLPFRSEFIELLFCGAVASAFALGYRTCNTSALVNHAFRFVSELSVTTPNTMLVPSFSDISLENIIHVSSFSKASKKEECIRIITAYDADGTLWNNGVDQYSLQLVVTMARYTLNRLNKLPERRYEQFLGAPVSEEEERQRFNFTIKCSDIFSKNSKQQKQKYANLSLAKTHSEYNNAIFVVNPLKELYDELQAKTEGVCLLFPNMDYTEIGVVLRPDAFKLQESKVDNYRGVTFLHDMEESKPKKEGEQRYCVFSISQLIALMNRTLEGVIEEIVWQT
ncbi:hypothetical protein PCE1_000528 [Barthelona sp. PCE]